MKLSKRSVKSHFGSWNKDLEKIGLEVRHKTPVEVTENDEQLLQMYIDFSIKIGKGETGATIIDLKKSDEIYNISVFEGLIDLERIGRL